MSRTPRRAVVLAAGSTACGAAVCVVVALGSGDLGVAVASAVAGVVLLVAGLVTGFGAIATLGLAVALVAAIGALGVAADADAVRSEALLVGALLWLGFELACRSFEVRPAAVSSPDARVAWVVDLALVGTVSASAGGLALMLVGVGPVGGIGLRVGAMAVVVAAVTSIWLVARARRLP